eukprot:CAMPEP_0113992506 /NCGR_PEP_ID=MMETSP0328-20130328/9641_1 /TAXON_ID=39455 /ORGANISM="Alexandrium minutum" /LENGTH=47 /assembly_acc=CAM_ASM_000350
MRCERQRTTSRAPSSCRGELETQLGMVPAHRGPMGELPCWLSSAMEL